MVSKLNAEIKGEGFTKKKKKNTQKRTPHQFLVTLETHSSTRFGVY